MWPWKFSWRTPRCCLHCKIRSQGEGREPRRKRMTMTDNLDILDHRLDWQTRMAAIVDMMREMSRQTDPQAMVRAYGARMRQILPSDVRLSLSRRNLPAPH